MQSIFQYTPSPTGEPVLEAIDRECLAGMWRDVGATLFTRLTKLFETERDQLTADMQTALMSDDRQSLARAAHSLKTSAAYICAARLREAAMRLERGAPDIERAALERLVEAVIAETASVAGELPLAIAEAAQSA